MKSRIPLFCLLSIFLIAIAFFIIIEHSMIIVNSQKFEGQIVGFKVKGGNYKSGKRLPYPIVEFIDSNAMTMTKKEN